MRILHTSDWHLGRKFGDHPLLEDQTEFLRWLVELVEQRSIDLVAVAGDIYDRAIPSGEAMGIFSETIRRLEALDVKLVAIAGNHDSAMRFDALDGITNPDRVLIRGGYRLCDEVLVWNFGDTQLAILAVPFLDPHLAPESMAIKGSHEDVLTEALKSARQKIPDGARTLVLSHSFVIGGKVSESERELSVGSAAMVPAELFEGFDYVALGHLHRAQEVGAGESVRYSGSPLAYSFSETSAKSVSIVEISHEGLAGVELVEIPVGRGVQSLIGTIAELCEGEPSALWTRVELTDPRPVLDAQRRLRVRFPRIVEVARPSEALEPSDGRLTITEVRSTRPEDLANDFWTDATGNVASRSQKVAMAEALSIRKSL